MIIISSALLIMLLWVRVRVEIENFLASPHLKSFASKCGKKWEKNFSVAICIFFSMQEPSVSLSTQKKIWARMCSEFLLERESGICSEFLFERASGMCSAYQNLKKNIKRLRICDNLRRLKLIIKGCVPYLNAAQWGGVNFCPFLLHYFHLVEF